MSSDKPTKSDILEELESIRGFLNEDEELIDDIPTLTVVAAEEAEMAKTATEEDIVPEAKTNESEQASPPPLEARDAQQQSEIDNTPSLNELADNSELIEELDLDLEIDTLVIDDAITEPQHSTSTNTQQTEIQTELPFLNVSTPPPQSALNEAPMPKGAGENPFLPPHIRERLGRHKEVFSQFQEYEAQQKLNIKHGTQSNLLNGSELPPSNVALDPLESTKDALINDIIGEFLPKIEARLREKLKSHLNAWKDDK